MYWRHTHHKPTVEVSVMRREIGKRNLKYTVGIFIKV